MLLFSSWTWTTRYNSFTCAQEWPSNFLAPGTESTSSIIHRVDMSRPWGRVKCDFNVWPIFHHMIIDVMYSLSCYIGPGYNGMQLYCVVDVSNCILSRCFCIILPTITHCSLKPYLHIFRIQWPLYCCRCHWTKGCIITMTSQERHVVLIQRAFDCLFHSLCWPTSKKHQSPHQWLFITGEFPTQRTSNGENASIWWRLHVQAW